MRKPFDRSRNADADKPRSKLGRDKPRDKTASVPAARVRGGRDTGPDPWRVPVVVEQIPESGLTRDIQASDAECSALAHAGGLRSIAAAAASLTLVPRSDGTVRVTGRATARVGQICVVTLDPMESAIDEAVDLVFAPAESIRELAATVDDDPDAAETIDPPEPIDNGIIDIGRVATDAIFLGIDPYPRKPGAVLSVPTEDADPDAHPFAALRALKPPGDAD